MSVLTKVLRAGEGKKVRRLAELVPLVNALEPEMEARSDEELAHSTVDFRERLDRQRRDRRLRLQHHAAHARPVAAGARREHPGRGAHRGLDRRRAAW